MESDRDMEEINKRKEKKNNRSRYRNRTNPLSSRHDTLCFLRRHARERIKGRKKKKVINLEDSYPSEDLYVYAWIKNELIEGVVWEKGR